MQVVYLGRASRRTNPPPQVEGDVIELLSNNWDDYGYKTSFPVTCRLNGENVDLPSLRLLVAGARTSSTTLDRMLNEGWDGVFPIPDADYLSVPTEITFYEQIEGSLGIDAAIEAAKQLRDASYFVHVADDDAAKALVDSDGFRNSLQRERASTQAFMDGWRVFERQAIAVLDLGFRFENVFGNRTTLELKFQPRTRLPHDVNVLIGPNGYGKSQLLHQMVRDWISPSEEDEMGFVKKPNLSQLVVISYSPFERFPVDLAGRKLQDQEAYRYFGLRGRTTPSDPSKLGRITLSHDYPKRNAAQSLIQCLVDDRRLRSIRDWSRKVATMERVLRTAISFDFAAVEVTPRKRVESFYRDTGLLVPLGFDVGEGADRQRFIPIGSDRIDELDDERLTAAVEPASGVTFFLDGQPIELSSGQRLFAYIVINILGAIRRNSLILVDEPELFLHPTLEIQFVDMLKTILSRFNSKALLATHSVVTVREIPSQCVHVFEKTNDDVVLRHPPFQTFGGDFQRISSYVFGDKAVSKPFEAWIKAQLDELETADALIAALGDDLNEELIVLIKAMERGQW
jgi:energy-coupling factor transporter ATP-binding protein EcfA2